MTKQPFGNDLRTPENCAPKIWLQNEHAIPASWISSKPVSILAKPVGKACNQLGCFGKVGTSPSLLESIQAKRPRPVIVCEQFTVPCPTNNGPQGTVGIILVQMILELELEPSPRRPVTLPLVEHLANMGGERHEPDKVFAEQPFALFRLALNEEAAGGGQFDGTVLELGELEDTQGRSNRKEIVDIERK